MGEGLILGGNLLLITLGLWRPLCLPPAPPAQGCREELPVSASAASQHALRSVLSDGSPPCEQKSFLLQVLSLPHSTAGTSGGCQTLRTAELSPDSPSSWQPGLCRAGREHKKRRTCGLCRDTQARSPLVWGRVPPSQGACPPVPHWRGAAGSWLSAPRPQRARVQRHFIWRMLCPP